MTIPPSNPALVLSSITQLPIDSTVRTSEAFQPDFANVFIIAYDCYHTSKGVRKVK